MQKKPTLFNGQRENTANEKRSTSKRIDSQQRKGQEVLNKGFGQAKTSFNSMKPNIMGKEADLDYFNSNSTKPALFSNKNPTSRLTVSKQPPVPSKILPKAPKLSVQRDTFLSATRKQTKPIYSQGFRNLPRAAIFRIFEFVYQNPTDYFILILLCKDWYTVLADSLQTWRTMKLVTGKNSKVLQDLDIHQFTDGKSLRKLVQQACVTAQLGQLNVFMKKVSEMYQYNSMKMNIPNKIIDWLQLTLDVKIGKEVLVGGHKYTYNKMNYAGFIYTEIKKISKLKFHSFDNLKISLIFRSPRLLESVEFQYEIPKRDILESCKKTRLFNYYIQKNLAFIYFDGDDSILKCLFEVSSVHLILQFSDLFGKKKASIATGVGSKVAKKFETQYERLSKAIGYSSIADYLREQTHFEVSVSIHNGKDRVFYFVNTTSRPGMLEHPWSDTGIKSSSKRTSGNQDFQNTDVVRFMFEKLGEPLDNTDVYLKLNNELGISEKINDLIFCEVMVKDQEKIRFIDSGLRVFQRQVSQDEMRYDYSSKMVLFAEERGRYSYLIEIHQDDHSTLLNTIDIRLHAGFFIS